MIKSWRLIGYVVSLFISAPISEAKNVGADYVVDDVESKKTVLNLT